jgi:hypothetical protein
MGFKHTVDGVYLKQIVIVKELDSFCNKYHLCNMGYVDFHGKKYDCHGKTMEEFDQIIDRLFQGKEVVQIVTGNGKGILKERLYQLQKTYDFRILQVAHNGASYIVDFTD